MSASPFDHPLLAHLLGDRRDRDSVRAGGGAQGDAALLEAALAEAEAEEGVIPAAAAVAITGTIGRFKPDHAGLAEGIARDGLVVPALVKQLRAALSAPHAEHLHVGTTSQDLIDTGLALRLRAVVASLLDRQDQRVDRAARRAVGQAGQGCPDGSDPHAAGAADHRRREDRALAGTTGPAPRAPGRRWRRACSCCNSAVRSAIAAILCPGGGRRRRRAPGQGPAPAQSDHGASHRARRICGIPPPGSRSSPVASASSAPIWR